MAGTAHRVAAMALDERAIFRWLEESCRAQGISVIVTDREVLNSVAALLGGKGGSERPRPLRPRRPEPSPENGTGHGAAIAC